MSERLSLPVRVALENGRPTITCVDFETAAFAEPFFSQSIRAASDAARIVIPHDEFRAALGQSFEPAGFIFHMSRCGSTLVSQLLKEMAGVRVYSEPPAINHALSLASRLPRCEIRDLLQALIRAFCSTQARVFFKFSSWNVLEYSLFHELFPSVPKLFIVRRPVEVLASIEKAPPGFIGNRAAFLDAASRRTGEDAASLDDLNFAAVMLSLYLEAIAAARNGMTRVVDYTELPQAVWRTLPAFFGIDAGEIDVARLESMSSLYSKSYPQRVRFNKEDERLTETDSAILERCAAKWIESRYDELISVHCED